MPNHRFYTPTDLHAGQQIALDKGVSNHILKVLRLGDGAEVTLFNGDGLDYQSVLVQEGKLLNARIIEARPNTCQSPVSTHLGQGICRGDRMDYSIQKAVEMGISIITPLITERVQFRLDNKRLAKKMQHWQGVIESACEQSGRAELPELRQPESLPDWLAAEQTATLILAPEADQSIGECLDNLSSSQTNRVRLVIGPEGGLSAQELQLPAGQLYRVSIGPRILRTETAGTAVLALIQQSLGDFRRAI